MDNAVKISEEAVKKYELKCKGMKAQALIIGATTTAAVVGAIPIDFPDAIILTPLETTLITGISKIYKLDQNDDNMKQIISHIVEAGTVSIVAKTAINQLKLIPGIANIAADVLNAIVAGVIVLGIGEASTIIMEKAYLGETDVENLDWIDKIVEGSMGKTVLKITNAIAAQSGKINISDLLKAIFKNDSNVEKKHKNGGSLKNLHHPIINIIITGNLPAIATIVFNNLREIIIYGIEFKSLVLTPFDGF